MNHLIQKLRIRAMYDQMINLSSHDRAPLILFWVSMAESIIFPIPPDVMLMPMVLVKPKNFFKIATVCLLGSIIGATIGYFIGYYFWHSAGLWIVENVLHLQLVDIGGAKDIAIPHWMYEPFKDTIEKPFLFHTYNQFGSWIICAFGFSPLPYKLVTLTAGAASLNFPIFIIASIISRGMRFYLVAFFIYLFGPKAKLFLEKNFNLISLIVVIAAVVIGIIIAIMR